MIANISPEIELGLRKQVERAVRPLRATERTKLRIRQELLAHLSDIYQEELSKSRSEGDAMEAALKRFGAPAELTAELARSLSCTELLGWWEERYERQLDRFFSMHQGESVLRWVARIVLMMAVLNGLLVGAVCAFAWATGGPDDPTTYSLLAHLFPLMIVGECTAVFSAMAIERLAARRKGLARWLELAAHSVVWSVILLLATAIFWWSIASRPLSPGEHGRLAIYIALTVAGMLVVVSFASDLSRRRKQTYDAWRQLEID